MQIGDEEARRQGGRSQCGKDWAVSCKQLEPTTELQGLKNTNGVGEGQAKAVAKDAGFASSRAIKRFWHWVVRVVDTAGWGVGSRQATRRARNMAIGGLRHWDRSG